MDDPEGLTPGAPEHRGDEGIRSTRRPRAERSDAGEPADPADPAELNGANESWDPAGEPPAGGQQPVDVESGAASAATGTFAFTGELDEADPISALRNQLRARAAADPLPARPTSSEMPVLESVERSRAAEDERRRQLWRDSATILIGVVLVLLLGQTFFPQVASGPGESPTPLPSTVDIGSFGPPVSLPPGATFGPIIDPSLGIDRTPTPIPVITMGPTPTPSPSPEPSATKKPSPKPTTKPSVKPSAGPSVPPPTAEPTAEPTPVITEPPPDPPVASFTWTATLLSVAFTSTSTGDTSWAWEFGDPAAGTSSEENPTYLYLAPGDYTVKLTVTGPGGSDSVTEVVSVTGT